LKSIRKIPEKLRVIPRAQMLQRGSYRLVEEQEGAVTIKGAVSGRQPPAQWNEPDWILALHEAMWDRAQFAYYEGLDAGFKLGADYGRQEAEKATADFRRMMQALEMSLLEFYNGLERWSVKLSLAVAEKVIGQAANEHEQLVKATVRRALAEIADRTRILVRVHPSDYEAMKSMRSEITSLSEGIEHFKIESDGSVTPGSCRVETPSGLLDADFTAQLAELRRALILHEEVGA
jgi:flagellar biosynthesis/type III secretory pathway protein FliH